MDCNPEKCPVHLQAQQNKEDIQEFKNMRIEGRLAAIETTLAALARDVGILVAQPSKRWEMIIGAMIVGGVTLLAEILVK